MRLMNVVVVLLLSISSLFGQGFAVGTPVKILDFGELYSTFSWQAEDVAALKASLGSAMADAVVSKSAEENWPKGIASLDARSQNRPLMAGYTTFYLTALDATRAILFVPAVENSGMATDMQPAGDIYFIVNSSAVAASNTGTVTHPAASPTTDGFAAQLDAITQDFKDDFVFATGEMYQEDEEGFLIWYRTRLPLDGADELYFLEDLLSGSTIFHAGFPGSTDPAIALKGYQELVRKVEALKLTCCALAKNAETVDGNRRQQTFKTYDISEGYDFYYQGMVIDIGIEQGETFDDQGQVLSLWSPVLSIYEE